MNRDSADTPYKPDVDLHIAQDTIHVILLDQRRQNQLPDCPVMFQMQQVNCRNWVVKVKSKPYARTNAGRRKSETTWIVLPIQGQLAVPTQQDPQRQDIEDPICTHVPDERGQTQEQALLTMQTGQHLTSAAL